MFFSDYWKLMQRVHKKQSICLVTVVVEFSTPHEEGRLQRENVMMAINGNEYWKFFLFILISTLF